MRYVVVCDAADESAVIVEARKRLDRSSGRIVVLSPRRGEAFEANGVLSVPMQFALQDAGEPNWRRKHRVRKSIAIAAGLRSARFFDNIEDLLVNIEACDPDVVDLGELGGFGRWLRARCSRRLPGRRIITDTDHEYSHAENVAGWRSYDPTALVSIVLPVYNGEKYLGISIESCLSQTHQNLELIIVDDCSLDNTPAIVEKYAAADPRIKFVKNEENLGLPKTLNVGFKYSQGDFLTWTSDDNIYANTAIQYMVQQLCTFTEICLVYCGQHHIDDTGNRIGAHLPLPPTALGPYRPAYRYVEDWDFFIRACLKFPAKFYFETCYSYRYHIGSLTNMLPGGLDEKWKLLGEKLYRDHFGSGHNEILVPTLDQLRPRGVVG